MRVKRQVFASDNIFFSIDVQNFPNSEFMQHVEFLANILLENNTLPGAETADLRLIERNGHEIDAAAKSD